MWLEAGTIEEVININTVLQLRSHRVRVVLCVCVCTGVQSCISQQPEIALQRSVPCESPLGCFVRGNNAPGCCSPEQDQAAIVHLIQLFGITAFHAWSECLCLSRGIPFRSITPRRWPRQKQPGRFQDKEMFWEFCLQREMADTDILQTCSHTHTLSHTLMSESILCSRTHLFLSRLCVCVCVCRCKA